MCDSFKLRCIKLFSPKHGLNNPYASCNKYKNSKTNTLLKSYVYFFIKTLQDLACKVFMNLIFCDIKLPINLPSVVVGRFFHVRMINSK